MRTGAQPIVGDQSEAVGHVAIRYRELGFVLSTRVTSTLPISGSGTETSIGTKRWPHGSRTLDDPG